MEAKCFDCAYYFNPDQYEHMLKAGLDNTFTCLAFYPNPIPEDILAGENGHNKPLPDQPNDLVFRPLTNIVKKK